MATFNGGRFVVLDFPVGKMPALDQTLFVFRQGLKVGEVKITGPERDHNTVADLISGEAPQRAMKSGQVTQSSFRKGFLSTAFTVLGVRSSGRAVEIEIDATQRARGVVLAG